MDLFEFNNRQKYDELVEQVRYHNQLYYQKAAPEITDAQYDALYRELEQLEAKHPEWVNADSPTQSVGNELSEGFARITHALPMQSIDDIFEKKAGEGTSDEALVDFYQRLKKISALENPEVTVEPKIDGCAVTLMYRGGELAYAATRGDGKQGDDISANVRTIKSVPQQLPEGAPAILELRGEIFIRDADFVAMNEQREEEGLPPFANPRNAAAGSLKLLDSQEAAKRRLDFIAHGLGLYEGEPLQEVAHFWNLLERMGIPSNHPVTYAASLEEMRAQVAAISQLRHELDYATDGAVIKLANMALREQIGSTARAPRWAAAYKFLPEQQETILKAITVQVGRTGILTPVAELEPVLISGSTVARATLHNESEIHKKDIRLGDTVLVEKAGEIIPSVVRVNKEKRLDAAIPYSLSDAVGGICPSCQSEIVKFENEVKRDGKVETIITWRCVNSACPAQVVRGTIHFCSRPALDIENMGESVVEALARDGLIREPLDLFSLSLEQLGSLNLGTEQEPRRYGEKRASDALAALSAAKELPLARWIYALGIYQVGATAAEQLAAYHQDWNQLAAEGYLSDFSKIYHLLQAYNAKGKGRAQTGAALREEMLALAKPWQDKGYLALTQSNRKSIKLESDAVMGISNALGAVSTLAAYDFMQSAAGQQVVQQMRELGINPHSPAYVENFLEAKQGVLSGKSIVVTGKLSRPRAEFSKMITEAGGKAAGSITASTSYLLAGEGGGSKRKKAEDLNIPIISEEEFLALLDS